MAETYEISKFESNMPLRCYIHHIGSIAKHMHEAFEIIFVLSGSCNLIMDDHLYQLNADDIFIIDEFIPHELRSNNCVYASLQLDRAQLEITFPTPIHPHFECNSQIPGKEDAFMAMRHKIAQIIKINADKPHGYEIRNWIYIYELMEILFINFREERSAALEKKNHRYAERVYEISKIIKEHYTEDLTLSSLADMMHLSVPYLSKFFMEQFGVNYLTYLTQLRLKNAEYELIHTPNTIETIAANCGFPNGNAFTSAFKREYGVLPSAYRRSIKSQPAATTQIEYRDYMASLKKYLFLPNEAPTTMPALHQKDHFSVSSIGHMLHHSWRSIVSVGQASDLLLAEVQSALSRAHREMNYEYIFFNGILSDTLYLYHRDINGNVAFNFAYVDRIFDFLRSINLKPMLSFSYMPRDLAKNPSHYLFNHLVSEPQNLNLWCDLIETFMNHIINRYGLDEIKTWRFTVWHQPNTPTRLYGFANDKDFFILYKKTRSIVKASSNDIGFGFPCMYYLGEDSNEGFIQRMLDFCREQDCLPDYFSYTFYDAILDHERNKTPDSFGFVDFMHLNADDDGLKKAISYMARIRQNNKLTSLPIYICEWNNTPSQQDYLNDTCYKSCYIVKNILENYDKVEGLAYWSLTDLMSEHPLPKELFFGGLGMFTVNGIPKASFYAMTLIRQLGDTFLARGDGWFATKTNSDIRILTYNYKHYSKLYSTGERFDMTLTDRYTMFEPSVDLVLSLSLEALPENTYLVREYCLNRDHGSSFDAWVTSGGIDFTSPEEYEYIEKSCPPMMRNYYANTEGNVLNLNIKLSILEVKLLIIKAHS